jgi:hypothetical protein
MYNTQFLQDFIRYQKGGAISSTDDISIGKIQSERPKVFSVNCNSLTCGT